MTDKELKKLSRAQLLELLVDQSREIDRLQTALDEAKKKLARRELNLSKCGSIAEASLAVTDILAHAQEAADLYLREAKFYVARCVAEEKPLPPELNETEEREGSEE